jgi:hypothetical protein
MSDPLLRRAALDVDAIGALTPECIEADTAAAWADGSLAEGERTALLTHAAGCGRCRALLAALVRTEPPGATAPLPWWKTPLLRWAAPLAAVTTAAVIWVAVERAPAPTEPSIARSARAVAGEQTAAEAPAAPPAEAAPVRERLEAKGRETAPRPAVGPRPAPPAEPQAKSAAHEDKRAAVDTVAPGRAEKAPAAAPPPAAQAETLMAPSDAAARFAGAPVIASPDGSTRWRVAAPGAIDRSTDGGATWQRQPLETAARLAAASSPAPDVCWFVGARGVVLRTTDAGRTWRVVSPPDPADLVAVSARDADIATVTTADGRTFRTTDGGVTWTR